MWLRTALAVGFLAVATGCGAKNYGAPLPVYVGGRAVVEPDGATLFGWPGVYVEGRFTGTSLTVRLRNGYGRLRLLIDGVERQRFESSGNIDVTIDRLGDGQHDVRLEKLSETQSDVTRLIGFYPGKSGAPLAPPARTGRQIEFIGDSYTVGYGDSSPVPTCTNAEMHRATDTQRAFGPLLARRFGADYRVNAYSGFGIVRNYDGSRAGETMPGLYPRLIPSDPSAVESDPGGWRPQIIVINLGTNDFSTPLHAGEAWKDQAALHAAYRARYVGFARDVMARQPQARLILMGSDAFIADVEQVAAELVPGAPGRIATVHFGGLDLDGCDGHPSLEDHQRLAGLLQARIGPSWPPAS